MQGLRERGYDAERLRLAGKDDEGDLVVRHSAWPAPRFTVIEAKSGAMHPAQFIREAESERANFARARSLPDDLVASLVIVKAPRKPWHQAYVLAPLDYFFPLEG